MLQCNVYISWPASKSILLVSLVTNFLPAVPKSMEANFGHQSVLNSLKKAFLEIGTCEYSKKRTFLQSGVLVGLMEVILPLNSNLQCGHKKVYI